MTQGQDQNWACSRQGKAVISGAAGGAVFGAIVGGNPISAVGGALAGGLVGYAGDKLSQNPNLSPFAQGAAGAVDTSPRAGGISTFVSSAFTAQGYPSAVGGGFGGIAYGALAAKTPYAGQLAAERILGGIKGGFAGVVGALASDFTMDFLNWACD